MSEKKRLSQKKKAYVAIVRADTKSYPRDHAPENIFSYHNPYGPASAFFAKPLMKVPYEGRTHLRERGRKKPCGFTTKAYGLAC